MAGSTFDYTIVITNNGPADVVGATVTDNFPVSITSASWSCVGSGGASCGNANGAGDINEIVDIPFTNGVSSYVTYTVTVTIDANATGDLINTATVTHPSDTDSDTDTDSPASLTITKDDVYTVVAPGSMLTYTIDIVNNGAVNLTGLVITDTLPAEVDYVSSSDGGSESDGVVTWDPFDLASAASTQRTLTVQVKAAADLGGATSLTNNVSIVDDGTTNITDDDDDTDDIALTNTKALIGSNHSPTTYPEVTIGEILTYRVNLVIPAGATMTNLRAVDVLDTGLAFDECQAITSTDLSTTRADGFSGACPLGGDSSLPDPAVTNTGQNITFNFGDVTNMSEEDRTLTLEYWVDVLDIAENINGVSGLNNALTWLWDGGELTSEALPVEIVEPDMDIVKLTDITTAVLGSTVPFSLTIAHTSESSAHAYDVIVTDKLPTGLEYIIDSISQPAGALSYNSFTYNEATTTITVIWDYFPLSATSTINFDTVFVGPAPVINEGSVAWTSLEIDPSDPNYVQSEYNDDSTERWYDPADQDGVDDYGSSSTIRIDIPRLPATGFAPNRVTLIDKQPPAKKYQTIDSTWIEIPDLGVELPIVGVPLKDDGWDLTWLDEKAGYLAGTAYPGLPGNTAITAHVYLPDGLPGPFVDLHTLQWGDTIILHANGQVYNYQIREKRKVWPRDLSVLNHEAYDWITLITCQSFNEKLDSYDYRIAVRAVLVDVQPEK